MQIAATVVMRSKFTLKIGYQLPQRLSFFSHHIGQQQRIQNAVTLRQIARIPDASRLLTADHNFAFHHQICDVLESDGTLVKLASVLGSDAVQHESSVESSYHITGPFLAHQQPTEQNGKNLM